MNLSYTCQMILALTSRSSKQMKNVLNSFQESLHRYYLTIFLQYIFKGLHATIIRFFETLTRTLSVYAEILYKQENAANNRNSNNRLLEEKGNLMNELRRL